MDLQTQAVNSNVAARRSVVGTSVGWAGGGEPGGLEADEVDFEVCFFGLTAIPMARGNQVYISTFVWEGHPTPKNLYSLLHIGRIWPMVLSEVTVPEWLRLDVMIVPVGNILK